MFAEPEATRSVWPTVSPEELSTATSCGIDSLFWKSIVTLPAFALTDFWS